METPDSAISQGGFAAPEDWRNILTRIKDPRQRNRILNHTDTEELNRLRTKYLFRRRREKLLEKIQREEHSNKHSSPSSASPANSNCSSRCSELNFPNEDHPSTPPPTLSQHPHHHHNHQQQQVTNGEHRSVSAEAGGDGFGAVGSDNDSGAVDMGDYETRVRPSTAFWHKNDGKNMAEKIIYYRTWKYKDRPPPPKPQQNEIEDEMETSLAVASRPKSGRNNVRTKSLRSAKSARTEVRRRSSDLGSDRAPTVIPVVVRNDVRQVEIATITSSFIEVADEKLPNVEENQYTWKRSESTKPDKTIAEELQLRKSSVSVRETGTPPVIVETVIDHPPPPPETGDKSTREFLVTPTEEGKKPKKSPAKKPAKKNAPKPEPEPVPPAEEPKNEAKPAEKSAKTRPPKPVTEPNVLIGKLDKKIERDLLALQGVKVDRVVDDDVDEATMNNILHGPKSQELDQFLMAR